jgi:transcription antitermination protein NusB
MTSDSGRASGAGGNSGRASGARGNSGRASGAGGNTSRSSFTGGDVTAAMTARRKARKRALDVLYQADLRGQQRAEVLTDYIARLEEPKPKYLPYTVTLVEGVEAHAERIDELLASYAEGWTLERMPVVDRNLARIAVFELLYNDEIDAAVAITEAVELAESLSTDDSPRFLNGILGRIADYAT